MTTIKKIMPIALLTLTISTVGVLLLSEFAFNDNASILSWNPFVEKKTNAGLIQTPNGNFAVPGFLAKVDASNIVDTMFLTDEPANWFKSQSGGALPDVAGTPLTVIQPGQAVDFDLRTQTDAKHTVSLLVPAGKLLTIDQAKADDDKITVQFNTPGVHLFACKVHPYMAGIVVVLDNDGNIPPVTDADLPFLAKAGIPEADALFIASQLTNIAPLPDDNSLLGKKAKWDILKTGDYFNGISVGVPQSGTFVPGVGEVWINTQFEKVKDQTTSSGQKPGSITVVDASTFSIIKEMNGVSNFAGTQQSQQGKWNNPHNMWTDVDHKVVYNGNWFGQWLNLIDMQTGDIQDSITVGKAPTHIVTIPEGSESGILTLPLSAERDILKIEDQGDKLHKIDSIRTGTGNNHPHGQWITSDGSKILIPNVFQGLGIAGSITVMDSATGNIIREIKTTDSDGANLLLPVAAAIRGNDRGYVSNIGTGTVSVIDLQSNPPKIINDIKVACFNPILLPSGDGSCANAPDTDGIVLETLKLPIQTPVSPDGKFVATAVFSLVSHLNPDTIAIIDANANDGKGALVAELPCPAGCHGVNWGAKQGGGYYAYVTSQHANVLTVVDPKSGPDAEIVAIIPLGDPTTDVTDGTGGQGILPLPLVSNGWIQDTVASCDAGNCSSEVTNWINDLTPEQQNP